MASTPWYSDSISECVVNLSHGRTYYLEAGDGEPVILLHGVPEWAGGDYWSANIAALSEYYHVYAPDFPGWGCGDRLAIEYSFAYLVDFVREFQDVLGISSAHVVGHSMGGWIAALLAYESPHRVRSLVLVNNGGYSTRTLNMMTEYQPPSFEQVRTDLQRIMKSDMVDVEILARRCFQRINSEECHNAYRAILRHMNHPLNRARYNLQRRLPHLRCPVLVIWGKDDSINRLEGALLMKELIRECEIAVLPCGHYTPSELPEDFNRCVLRFLDGK